MRVAEATADPRVERIHRVRVGVSSVPEILRQRRGKPPAIAVRYSSTMDAEPSPRELMTAVLDLHGAVTNGFAMVESRLDRVENRLDRVETQLTSVSGEVAGLQRWRLTVDAWRLTIDGWRLAVDGRLDRLEQAYYR